MVRLSAVTTVETMTTILWMPMDMEQLAPALPQATWELQGTTLDGLFTAQGFMQ
jgi:hypothetical protein